MNEYNYNLYDTFLYYNNILDSLRNMLEFNEYLFINIVNNYNNTTRTIYILVYGIIDTGDRYHIYITFKYSKKYIKKVYKIEALFSDSDNDKYKEMLLKILVNLLIEDYSSQTKSISKKLLDLGIPIENHITK